MEIFPHCYKHLNGANLERGYSNFIKKNNVIINVKAKVKEKLSLYFK
jgi:hypothetical protein